MTNAPPGAASAELARDPKALPDASATMSSSSGPSGRWSWLKDAVCAFSLSNLCLSQAWFSLLYDQDFGYYNKFRVTNATLLALVANLLGLAVVFWLGARWLRRIRNRWLELAAHLFFFSLWLIPLNFTRVNLLNLLGPQALSTFKQPVFLLGCAVVALCVVRWHRWAARAGGLLLVVVFPLSLFTVSRTGMLLCHWSTLAQHPAQPSPQAPLLPQRPATRVVWLLFDELDQRVGFQERPRGLQMPELDRVCREALVATNAYSPNWSTLTSVPSLVSGRMLTNVIPSGPSDLKVYWDGEAEPTGWGTQPGIFSQARSLGLNVGVVGWYLPYDREFGQWLTACSWYPFPFYEPTRAPTFHECMLNQLGTMAFPLRLSYLHLRLFEHALTDSRELLANPQFGLIFLHLPVPHRPGIYRPATRQLTITCLGPTTGYLNNLWLTDRTFGELRQTMEQAGTWDTSWVLISADHWWRAAAHYDGKTDHRVPFILKAPGRNPPATYSPAFNTVISQQLILAILRGEVAHAEDVVPWLDQHRVAPPKTYTLPTGQGVAP